MKIFSSIVCVFMILSIISIGYSRNIRNRRSFEWWDTLKDIMSSNNNQVKPEIECVDYSQDDDCLGDLVEHDPFERKTVLTAPCPANSKKDRAGRCRTVLKSRS